MDRIIETNRERWNALADAHVMHSKPFLDFDAENAAAYIYRHDCISDVVGKKVLCLASGGGQDSVAFGLLGADVTVFDLSDVQLSRDREAAVHHGLEVETIQGDMRNLSVFGDNTFDIVWQPYSLNYSPTVAPVFREVARVLKPGGIYHVTFANPYAHAVDNEWIGTGYPLRGFCIDGEDISYYYTSIWQVEQEDGSVIDVPRPHEFRHNLSTVLNTLAENGFMLCHLKEWKREGENPEPGSWVHFTQCMSPWFDSYWRLVGQENPNLGQSTKLFT